MKFKIGDRVKAISPVGYKDKVGVQGTVIGFYFSLVTVEFDEDIVGHDGSLCGRPGKYGYCWHCNREALILIDQPKTKSKTCLPMGLEYETDDKQKEEPKTNGKFKVGDRVRFKSWARMAKEYGVDSPGYIKAGGAYFVSGMKPLCNTVATVCGISQDRTRIFLMDFTSNSYTKWNFSPEMVVHTRNRRKKKLPLGLEYEADDKTKRRALKMQKSKLATELRQLNQ